MEKYNTGYKRTPIRTPHKHARFVCPTESVQSRSFGILLYKTTDTRIRNRVIGNVIPERGGDRFRNRIPVVDGSGPKS